MTQEQFKEMLKDFFNWSSSKEREPTSWLYSLEDWIQTRLQDYRKPSKDK